MSIPVPVIGGLIDAGSNIIDSVAQGFTNRANRKWSEKMYGRQRQDALSDWQMQNQYNSPQSQMERLKAAGLNPNLVYGSGATATGGEVRSSSAPPGQARAPQLGLGSSIDTYLKMRSTDADIDLKKIQGMVGLVEAVLKGKQAGNVAADTESKQFDTGLKRDLRDVSVQAATADLNKKLADTKFTLDANARSNAIFAPQLAKALLEAAGEAIRNAKTSQEIAEIKARINNVLADTRIKTADALLKESGVQPHDSAFWRALVGAFNGTVKDSGFDINVLENTIKEVIRKNKK
ncbi:MAG: DNA pilot protein [Microviridae sp.]|nr:MAG: DNA pilot protein [Microviridae sp.]